MSAIFCLRLATFFLSVSGLNRTREQAPREPLNHAELSNRNHPVNANVVETPVGAAGGGHRSGPGEHPDWQAAMRGLDTLSPLPGGEAWGAPAALPTSMVALKSLRQSWLGVTGTGGFVRECGGILPGEYV